MQTVNLWGVKRNRLGPAGQQKIERKKKYE